MPNIDDNDPTWNLAQLFVWCLTRDEGLVAKYSSGSPDAATRSKALFSALARNEIATDCVRAGRFILQALATGRLAATGVRNNKAAARKVPAESWAALEFADGELGIHARPRHGSSRNAASWYQLRFSAERSRTLWTLRDFQRQSMLTLALVLDPVRSDNPASIAQLARREARWRRAFGRIEPALLKGIAADGLPDDPDTKATEALSWMTLGVAIPPSVWRVFNTTRDRLADYGAARDRVNYTWRLYRDARRKYLSELLDPDYRDRRLSGSDAAVGHQVAVTQCHEAGKRLETACVRYLEAAAAEARVSDDIIHASALADRTAGWNWFVSRIQETERLLFKVIREGALVMRGRRSAAATEWETIPADHIRLPVHLNLSGNKLEPSGEGSMDQYKAVREGMPEWIDLLFHTSEIRANADRLTSLQGTGASAGKDSNPLKAGTILGEKLCREWLVTLMQREERPTRLKQEMRDEARAKFQISKRAFDRAWGVAVEESGNINWSQSGPRSSKR